MTIFSLAQIFLLWQHFSIGHLILFIFFRAKFHWTTLASSLPFLGLSCAGPWVGQRTIRVPSELCQASSGTGPGGQEAQWRIVLPMNTWLCSEHSSLQGEDLGICSRLTPSTIHLLYFIHFLLSESICESHVNQHCLPCASGRCL